MDDAYQPGDLVAVKGNRPGSQLAVILHVTVTYGPKPVRFYHLGWPRSGWDLTAIGDEIRPATVGDIASHHELYLAAMASRYGCDFTIGAAA